MGDVESIDIAVGFCEHGTEIGVHYTPEIP